MTAPTARGNPAVFTGGHSVRPLEPFLERLRGHGVQLLADVRTVPRSRRHPHFSRDALERSLPAAGIAYRHFPGLGGLRKPRRDSANAGWKHPSFRGYADHMGTEAFAASLNAPAISASRFSAASFTAHGFSGSSSGSDETRSDAPCSRA